MFAMFINSVQDNPFKFKITFLRKNIYFRQTPEAIK